MAGNIASSRAHYGAELGLSDGTYTWTDREVKAMARFAYKGGRQIERGDEVTTADFGNVTGRAGIVIGYDGRRVLVRTRAGLLRVEPSDLTFNSRKQR